MRVGDMRWQAKEDDRGGRRFEFGSFAARSRGTRARSRLVRSLLRVSRLTRVWLVVRRRRRSGIACLAVVVSGKRGAGVASRSVVVLQ